MTREVWLVSMARLGVRATLLLVAMSDWVILEGRGVMKLPYHAVSRC